MFVFQLLFLELSFPLIEGCFLKINFSMETGCQREGDKIKYGAGYFGRLAGGWERNKEVGDRGRL